MLAVVAMLLQAPAATAEVSLTMRDGRVTLKATHATLREILAEWAKIGRTTILNADRVVGGPITVELTDVPEGVALGVLLRSVSGFVAAPRAVALENASHFDRILVLPTSAPPRTTAATAPPAFAVPPAAFSPQLPQPADPADERDALPPQNPRGPAFSGFPQPQIPSEQPAPGSGQQPAPPVYQPRPGAATGAAVPGMVVPVPQPDQSTPQPRTF